MIPEMDFSYEFMKKDKVIHRATKVGTNKYKLEQLDPDEWCEFPIDTEYITIEQIRTFMQQFVFDIGRPDKYKLLEGLELETYDPIAICKKTHGAQFARQTWIRFKGEDLCYDDVKL